MSTALGLAVGSNAGLIISALFISFAKTEAAQITNLAPRKNGGSGGSSSPDDDPDDPDDDPPKCVSGVCLVCVKQTCITVTSTPPIAPAASTAPTPTLIQSSPSLTSTNSRPSVSNPAPTSTSTSSSSSSSSTTRSGDLSASTQLPTIIPNHSRVAVGSIVGGVLGSLVALGLVLMMAHKCVARKRKARKRPSGFVPATYFNAGNTGNNNRSLSDPEMSQTHSSPLISTAMAAHVASRHSTPASSAYSSASPVPISILSNASSTPHRNLSTSVSASTSSHRRASLSETEGSSHWPHEPLLNPYEMPPPAWSINNPNPTSTLTEITSPSPTLSRESRSPTTTSALASNVHASTLLTAPGDTNLLRSMTAFQKALEADGEKPRVEDESNSAGPSVLSDTKKDNQYDPPPQYRD